MTKTLTEQWKDGELHFGKTYWCSDDEGNVAKLVLVNNDRFYEWTLGTEVTKDVKEVLAPVPSYDEYNGLKQDNKCLKSGIETRDKQIKLLQELEACEMANCEAQEIIACLEQQLQEANDLIMWVVRTIPTGNKDEDDFDRYIEKWGVK